jgi:putative PIN family toxin of toxin-antitoxin system
MSVVVLDTNCLLVALPVKSPYYWLWQAFRSKKITLCYTNDILQEYQEVLSRVYPSVFVSDVINELLYSKNARQTNSFFRWNLIVADPDDNKFVDCALSAGAEYIITHDKHFNVLKDIPFPKIEVVDMAAFKQTL